MYIWFQCGEFNKELCYYCLHFLRDLGKISQTCTPILGPGKPIKPLISRSLFLLPLFVLTPGSSWPQFYPPPDPLRKLCSLSFFCKQSSHDWHFIMLSLKMWMSYLDPLRQLRVAHLEPAFFHQLPSHPPPYLSHPQSKILTQSAEPPGERSSGFSPFLQLFSRGADLFLQQGFQLGVILPSGDVWQWLDTFAGHNLGGCATGI